MKNYLLNIDRKTLPILRMIGKEAEHNGMSAYIVGGIVRDIIMRKENSDLDIVVDGDATLLAKMLADRWKSRVTIYGRFKTASLKTPEGLPVDLATARREYYACSGALPTVRSGSLKEDFFRRDFTINAMAIAIHPGCFGQLIDECGGLNDLKAKKVRILHDRSFIDDPTRILRAVRFEQRFGFRDRERTLSLAKAVIRKNVLENIKPARYFAEFKKILSEGDPFKCLKRLYSLAGLKFIDEQLMVDLRELKRLHQRIQSAKQMSFYKGMDFGVVYWMGLLSGSSATAVERILGKFPFTKEERGGIRQGRNTGGVIKELSARDLPASHVYQILKPMTLGAILYLRVQSLPPAACKRVDRFLAKDRDTKLFINGEDLKRIGIVSGTEIGQILKNVLYQRIDRHVRTKGEELGAVLRLKAKKENDE